MNATACESASKCKQESKICDLDMGEDVGDDHSGTGSINDDDDNDIKGDESVSDGIITVTGVKV